MSDGLEYQIVAAGTNDMVYLQLLLNRLGSVRWEVVGLTAADRTIGLNQIQVILKRPWRGFTAPDDIVAGWKPDPTERHQYRWCDGMHWEAAVNDDGTNALDWPIVRPVG